MKLVMRRVTSAANWHNSDKITHTANCTSACSVDFDTEDAPGGVGADVVFFVKDTGIGVAAEMKDQLFMPYQVPRLTCPAVMLRWYCGSSAVLCDCAVFCVWPSLPLPPGHRRRLTRPTL